MAKRLVQELIVSGDPPSKKITTMDPKIWKKFPEELFEVVCVRLPISTFFRFLSVSRKWNSLLTSSTFKEQCARVPNTSQPWIYTMTYNNGNLGAMYDPSTRKWHHPRIPSLPNDSVIIPIASVGGLVCLADIGYNFFYLSNPVTQMLKQLPIQYKFTWLRIVAGMTLNGKSTTEGYKILCVSCHGDYAIFDSITNLWDISKGTPPAITLPIIPSSSSYRTQTISVGGCVYFKRLFPEGVISYNMVSGEWKELLVPTPHRLIIDQILAECRGRILLVGLIARDLNSSIFARVSVWELQKMTLLWKEVDTIPNERCSEFYGKNTRMFCVGNKDLILLLLRSSQLNRLVSYDAVKKEWSNVRESIVPRGRERDCIPYGTTFYPSITATT